MRFPLAALVTVLGALLCIGGVVTAAAGMGHRYESAQTAITVREGEPPSDADGFVFSSMDVGDGTSIDENVAMLLQSSRRSLLRVAELSGSFTVPTATMWADRSTGSIVTAYDESPDIPFTFPYFYPTEWRPFAYMVPAFIGALLGIGGLFWMATRWQLTASDRRREIDETRD